MDDKDKWNWLEWVHHSAQDVAIHTGTSYQEAMSALTRASNMLAEAWDDGYGAAIAEKAGSKHFPNPYRVSNG